MDIPAMVEKLKARGIKFAPGLTNAEIKSIEDTYGFKYPKEIKEFFLYAYPTCAGFINYKNTYPQNIAYFKDFQSSIREAFIFDLENNRDSMHAMLDEYVGDLPDDKFNEAVLSALDNSPKLIPFVFHRCFFDGMDGMPIVSFAQATDVIFYGTNLENYLENEFLNPNEFDNNGEISESFKNTGIWYHLIW